MRTSINIARTELRTLFFSPIAWLVLVIFAFQCGLGITDILSKVSADSNAGFRQFNLTGGVLAYFNGYFAVVQKTVYLYLPLLTMGLLSREISSGSIKLLYSAPLTALELVAGKYMAMLVYCLLMALITIAVTIPAIMTIPHFDYGILAGGVASTFLLIAVYAAIGLFMSCLTGYQVVAAISTMVLLGGLNYIGEVGKGTDVIRDVTGFLSVSGRGENLRDGLFMTSDLSYFLLVIIFFLSVSVQYLDAQQQALTLSRKLVRALLLTGTLALAGLLSSNPRFTAYYDLTRTRQRTLTASARHALLANTAPLTITTYINILDENFWPYGSPEKRREDEALWAPYVRFKPSMGFNYIYYYGRINSPNLYQNNPKLTDLQIAEKKAEAYGISMDRIIPAEKLPVKDLLQKEGNRTVRILASGGRLVPLRMYDGEMDANPYEQEITDALRVLHERPLQVAVLDGEAERGIIKEGDRDYKMIMTGVNYRNALINHGFEFRTIQADSPVPADIDILIIADPRTAFTTEKSANLLSYIHSGRNLLIMGEPGKAAVINPLLASLDVEMRPGIVVQRSKDFPPAFVRQKMQPSAGELGYPGLAPALNKDVTSTGIGALDLKRAGHFNAFPILRNDPAISWYRNSMVLPDTGQIVFEPRYGDQNGTLVTAFGLRRPISGQNEQRIIISADADWLTMAEFYRNVGERYNPKLVRAVFSYLGNGRFPKDLTRVEPPDGIIVADKKMIFRFRIIFLGVLPGLLLLSGAILLIRRRGR